MPKHPTIGRRLLVWFLPLCVLPLLAALLVVHEISRFALEEEATKNLVSIADARARRIEAFARDRLRDSALLAARPTLTEALAAFSEASRTGLGSAPYREAAARFGVFLAYYVSLSQYEDLMLVNVRGDVVFSVRGGEEVGTNLLTGIYSRHPLGRVFARASTLVSTEISAYAYHPATNLPALFIATPVYDQSDQAPVGALILQVNNDGIDRVINDYAGLGRTGEAVAALRDEDRVVVTTPLRNDPYAAFRRRLPLDDPRAAHMLAALNGQRGWVRGPDYRGEPVLSVQRYLPSFDWGLVVKINQSELLAPIRAQRNLLLAVALATALATALAAVMVARTITRPITRLADAAHEMAGGRLDQSIPIETADETGRLAAAFNTMARELRASHDTLQSRLDAKTQDLVAANQELRQLNTLKTKLFSIISHDLRGAIGNLSSALQLVNDRDISQEEFYAFASDLQTSADGVQLLLENLLLWSHSQLEGATRQPVAVPLAAAARELATSLHALTAAKDLDLQLDIPADLKVSIDPNHLRLILRNLVSNACKYSPEGGRIELRATVPAGGDQATITVTDHGVGIAADRLGLLNAPMVPGQENPLIASTRGTRGETGTGLGLGLTREHVEANGATLRLDSATGEGVTATLRLPLAS